MTNKKSTKNLTLSSIKHKNKQYNETFEELIDGHSIQIYKKWSPTKIHELITEFITNLEKEMKSQEGSSISSAYLSLLFFRYFTNLPIPKELPKQLEWLDELINSGYLIEIMKLLPQDQIDIANDQLKLYLNQLHNNLPVIESVLQNVELENEEVETIKLKTISD
jgi:hypothetical protein